MLNLNFGCVAGQGKESAAFHGRVHERVFQDLLPYLRPDDEDGEDEVLIFMLIYVKTTVYINV
jgi:hypothetical protein